MDQQQTEPVAEDPDVVAALARLAALEGMPVDEHASVFEDIHATLRASLSRPASG